MQIKRTVLIVDDSGVNRQILTKILEDTYCVLEAEDGRQALEILEVDPDRISAVLLDIIMPVMDGYRFLEIQQATPKIAGVPVIVTTQKDAQEDEVKALAYGASDFLTKPYKPQIIRHRLNNIIKLRETAAFVNKVERDELTGLYNKEGFYSKVRNALERHPKRAYDIICMDIEGFKLINDMFGESEGDKLLCYMSRKIESVVSYMDGLACRLGSDVFSVMIERRERYEENLIEKILGAAEQYPLNVKIIIKIGIYQIEDDQMPIRMMCDSAKMEILTVKGKYDASYAYYDDSIRNRIWMEQHINGEMKNALVSGQYEVYFQPKVSIVTGEIIGAEALVRWIHPVQGRLAPTKFVPLFERNGFIAELDMYVWQIVCQQLRSWLNAGIKPIPLSVNVSRVDIYNPRLPDIFKGLIEEYDLDASLLRLEITESAYTENSQQLIEVVTRLKAYGFAIEMDDFGTGFSSLNMLNEVPVDTLKMDMSFLQQRKNNTQDIIKFIINLAGWLQLSVVAEGVEDEEQVEFLKELGCDYGQGYYYSKPLPAEQFESLLLNIRKKQRKGECYE